MNGYWNIFVEIEIGFQKVIIFLDQIQKCYPTLCRQIKYIEKEKNANSLSSSIFQFFISPR